MNIKQLESLVSIVENGGFAAAAERLHTTQSAVSARIKELEKYLGIALFDRSSHRARLTAKGEELLPCASTGAACAAGHPTCQRSELPQRHPPDRCGRPHRKKTATAIDHGGSPALSEC